MKVEYDSDDLGVRNSRFAIASSSNDSSSDDDGDLDAPARKSRRSLRTNNNSQMYGKAQKTASPGNDPIDVTKLAAAKYNQTQASSRTSMKSNSTGVGSTAAKRPRKQTRRRRNILSNAEIDSDVDEEDSMPSYLRRRRQIFDERAERLKQAGLELPPTYKNVEFSDDERIESLKERPVLSKVTPPATYKDIEMPYSLGVIPAPIAQYLREYQVQGAAFLHELFVYQKGGILGDDMGLGKTIQVIAFLTAMYGKTGDERDSKRMRKMRNKGNSYFTTLIICPGSLMANWEDELRKWGWWHTEVFHGSGAHKDAVLASARSGRLEIMITTYRTYCIQKEKINAIQWDCVIADECHIIKEHDADVTKSMLEVNALCRIGLTGTPVQNNYEELWTLLNWTNPGRLGDGRDWKRQVSKPLKLGQSHYATGQELATARKTAQLLVHNLLPQFFLRRMKTLIQDQLPKKSDRVVFCPLTEAQQSAYRSFIASEYIQIIKERDLPCSVVNGDQLVRCKTSKGEPRKQGWCHQTMLSNGDTWQQWVFPCILYLQKLSNHLALLIPSGFDDPEKQDKDTDLLSVAMPNDWVRLCEQKDSIMNYAAPEFCGKWKVLKKLLKFWYDNGNNKVLVFSHSVRLLRMLQQLFVHTKYNVAYLDGSMKYEDRYKCVQDFNTDPNAFVFLISTRAGGVGLNITSANKVVVVDPNWNPAHDLQAQDRAYRIGQTRDVEVFRLVSQGTVEEVVYARQIYKQQQANISLTGTNERRYFEGVQGNKTRKGEIFGLDNLFAEPNEHVVLREIVNKTNVAEARAGLDVVPVDLDGTVDASTTDGVEDHAQTQNTQEDRVDKTLNQIADAITGKTQRESKAEKHDPIQAILATAGVDYTHENSEVIGESKVEAALSKRAADNTESQNRARVFASTQSQGRQRCVAAAAEEGEDFRYTFHPPEDVKLRQFAAMAKWAGYDNIVLFALDIQNFTQSQRRDFLDKWYVWRREQMRKQPEDNDESADSDYSRQSSQLPPAGNSVESANGLKTNEHNAWSIEEPMDIRIEKPSQSRSSAAAKTRSTMGTGQIVVEDNDEEDDEDEEL